MKKILAVLAATCMILGLTACGGGNNDPTAATKDDGPGKVITGREAIDVIGEDGIDWNHMSMDELYGPT